MKIPVTIFSVFVAVFASSFLWWLPFLEGAILREELSWGLMVALAYAVPIIAFLTLTILLLKFFNEI